MKVVFANLVLWPFLALVTAPLLVHLFARTRPPVYRFSSVEFILRAVRETLRVRRPRDWLVLFLRTLLFSALIFLFLQPLFFSRGRLPGAFERKNVVLIVDATASMGCTEGAQTRFAGACAYAADVLGGLTSRDQANIVWLRARPVAEFPALGINVQALRAALRRAPVTSETGNPLDAWQMALELLKGAEGRREIHVVSDFQASQWERVNIAAPPGVEVVKFKVGDETAANGALSDIRVEPARPLAGETVSICCEVSNFSPQPARRTVYLAAEEQRESREVLAPAWGRAVAVFQHRFSRPGAIPVTASLSEDRFPADDTRWAVVEVREALRVGLLARDAAAAAAWRRALDAVGWARVEQLAETDLAAAVDLDAVLLSGDSGAALPALGAAQAAGATVVWYPGTNLDAEAFSAAFNPAGQPVPGAVSDIRWHQDKTPHSLRIMAENDPVFRVFGGGEHGNPAGGMVYARLEAPRSLFPADAVLMAYDDDVPALARALRGGVLFFWNLPLGREQSDLAGRMEFVPLLAEMILSSRRGGASVQSACVPGERLVWYVATATETAGLRLLGPDGRERPVAPSQGGKSGVTSEAATEPGLYRWESDGRPIGYAAVNFPSVESDLRALASKSFGTGTEIQLSSGAVVGHLREGVPLWPWLLGAGVLLVVLEGVALLWAERT